MSDYFDTVKYGLADAVQRQSHLPWYARLRTPLTLRVVRAAPVIASTAVVLVVVGAVVAFTHGPTSSPSPQPTVGSHTSGVARQLAGVVGALARPQTLQERRVAQSRLVRAYAAASIQTVDVALTRKLGVAPWGQPIYVVVMQPKPPVEPVRGSTLPKRLAKSAPTFALDTGRRLAVGRTDSRGLRAFGVLDVESVGPHASRSRLIALVPNGVSKVTFILPAHPTHFAASSGPRPPAVDYRHVKRVTVPVKDNLAAIQVDRVSGTRVAMVWRDSNGHVVNHTNS